MTVSTTVRHNKPMRVTASGADLLVDGVATRLWGIRAASATQTQALADQLVRCIRGPYRSSRIINAVAVFYQGSSGGNSQAWGADGTTFSAGQAERMQQLAQACLDERMVLIAGLFYQSTTELTDRAAYEAATRLAAQSLSAYPNVIINIANEANSGGWSGNPLMDGDDATRAASIGEACGWVKAEDSDRLCGSGGYSNTLNPLVAAQSNVDVVLYDSFDTDTTAVYFDPLSSVTKPRLNVETFGGATGDITANRGEYDSTWLQRFKDDIDEVKARNTHLFFHDNRWTQPLSRSGTLNGSPYTVDDCRYDFGPHGLASAGTLASPGWGWWARYARDGV